MYNLRMRWELFFKFRFTYYIGIAISFTPTCKLIDSPSTCHFSDAETHQAEDPECESDQKLIFFPQTQSPLQVSNGRPWGGAAKWGTGYKTPTWERGKAAPRSASPPQSVVNKMATEADQLGHVNLGHFLKKIS